MSKSLFDRACAALAVAALATAGAITLQPLIFPSSDASDHTDSPLVDNGVELLNDIADIYAFISPTDSTKLVAVMTVHGHAPGSVTGDFFDNEGRYRFFVDNTIDANPPSPDAVVTITFDNDGSGQTFKVEGLTVSPITGAVGATVTSGAVKAFCGDREDPFFFDLVAFQQFVAAPYTPASGLRSGAAGAPADTFAGKNVAAIVLEFPISLVNPGGTSSGQIKVWAKTFRFQKKD
jgi:hypothetical protein